MTVKAGTSQPHSWWSGVISEGALEALELPHIGGHDHHSSATLK